MIVREIRNDPLIANGFDHYNDFNDTESWLVGCQLARQSSANSHIKHHGSAAEKQTLELANLKLELALLRLRLSYKAWSSHKHGQEAQARAESATYLPAIVDGVDYAPKEITRTSGFHSGYCRAMTELKQALEEE